MRLILASASPRRAELLRTAGFTFEIVATGVDERVRDGESPDAYVRRLAAEKSAAAQARLSSGADALRHPEAADAVVILGADTAVVVDDEILGKPRDDADAARMLRRLSGRTHVVLTGVSLRAGAIERGCVARTIVEISALTAADVAWYVGSGEGRDKAGAYAIQGLASRFVPRIDGSYSNVVGLPVACVQELLREMADY